MNNEEWLKNNPYPGRGIVMGAASGGELVQIYWIMGRSENSKNRIFVQNADGSVSTKAFDETKVTDPSLIIYTPLKTMRNTHIISNGDQTDTIAEFLAKGKTFEDALKTRTYEPDAPNYTPRISGIFYPNGSHALSILKASSKENPKREAIFVEKETCTPSLGYMLTTYEGEEDPLVSFIGLPKAMPIKSTAEENLDYYWNMLNPKYRVSILVNWIENENNLVLIRNANYEKIVSTFTDSRDGKVYKTVKIGDQVWLAENLNYSGDGSVGVCYGNDESNGEKYGRLYDWNTAKKAVPPGWHLPSDDEWQKLIDFAGGDKVAGYLLKAKSGWGNNYNGIDKFGFAALPGGYGGSDFGNAGNYGSWWSASEDDANLAYRRGMYYDDECVYWHNYNKAYLFSVRCVQD